MTHPNDSAFAKPAFVSEQGVVDHPQEGLTKREYFAAMAMQGYCGGEFTGQSGKPHKDMAEWSVEMADSLIEALNKTKQP